MWVCLLAQFLISIDTARRLSPTHDEYWHLPLGLLIWKTGRFDYDVINPPLARLWAALPLLCGGAELDPSVPFAHPRDTGDLFWMSNQPHSWTWFVYGRWMIAILNLATGWCLARWAGRWYGPRSAIVTALLWACCPTTLAHGSLVTHDAAAAFGFVITLAAATSWVETPTRRRAIATGVALGLALLMKVTCILLIPLVVLAWCVLYGESRRRGIGVWKAWSSEIGLLILSTWLVVCVGYAFEGLGRPIGQIPFASQQGQRAAAWPIIKSLPTPLPVSYLRAFDRVAQDLEQKHPVYLNGDWSEDGFPTYYLWALYDKLPIGALGLIALAAWTLARRRREVNWRRQAVLGGTILAILLPASLGSNQIGIRYVLPVLPILYLFASQAALSSANSAPNEWSVSRVLLATAVLSLPLALRDHPHHLAYFNELVGGPAQGRECLADSNLDWGQDLHALARYLRERNLAADHHSNEPPTTPPLGLAYYGTVHPHSVGINYQLPPRRRPQPGRYAISVNFLVGRPFVIRAPTATGTAPVPTREHPDQSNDLEIIGQDEFGYFRFFTPTAQIGRSLFVFELTRDDVARFELARRRAGLE